MTEKQNIQSGNTEPFFQTDFQVCTKSALVEFSDSYFYTNICKNIQQDETAE